VEYPEFERRTPQKVSRLTLLALPIELDYNFFF
jgi:hypothetical protein